MPPRLIRLDPGQVTLPELARLAQISYRQADFWSRSGLLRSAYPAAGSGHPRGYPPLEVQVATVMGILVRAGLPPGAAASAARNQGRLAPGIRIEFDPGVVEVGWPETDQELATR